MAFTVQNDAGTVSGANAYITVAFADSYFSEVGNSTWSAVSTEAEKEQAIVKATRYMDSRFNFLGNRLLSTQTTQWPREGVYDDRNLEYSVIPTNIKNACAEYALKALSEGLYQEPVYDTTGTVQMKREKVGSLEREIEYVQGGGKHTVKNFPYADSLINEFTSSSNGLNRG